MKVTAVIAAGGKGTRMGADKNKVFLMLGEREIIAHTIEVFENNPRIDNIVIVAGGSDECRECENIIAKYGFKKVTHITTGGRTRRESVYNGLLLSDGEYVAIHDAARALVTDEIINTALDAAVKYGAAAPGVKCKDTLKTADANGFILSGVDRETTYHIQTPQVFRRDIIMHAHETVHGFEATDDCSLAEKTGTKIKITPGSYDNIKLTTPEDLITGENILKRRCGK